MSIEKKDLEQDFVDVKRNEVYDVSPVDEVDSSYSSSKFTQILYKIDKFIALDSQKPQPGQKPLTNAQLFLFNHDLKPVESDRRKWRWFNFIFFWIADSFNVNTFQIAGTGVAAGLKWWQVFITVWIGYFFCGVFVAFSARIGTYYHVSFPVSARAAFGIFGSLWPILNRVVMAIVWYSVQGWIGGQCVQLMLKSIFGNDLDTRIPDHVHSGIDSFKFLSFFLFWLFSLPAIWFPPHKIRHLFSLKAVVTPFAGFGFLIWALKKSGGSGPLMHAPATIDGSAWSWAFVASLMNSLANFATLIVNAPDFSRFATSKGSAFWSQLAAIPICFSITSLIGILITSSATTLYGKSFWNPLDILSKYLEHFTSGNRAGVFLISFGFAIAQLGTNIAANSLSAGTDMTAILPRYINIRRGGYICAMIALCVCPWQMFTTSSNFSTYLSAYTVFLSAIAGVIFSDYYAVRKGYLILDHMYSGTKNSVYRYNKIGCNPRAFIAYILGIAPNITGFAGACGATVPIGATRVYNLSWFVGFFTAFISYYVLCWFWPVAGLPEEFANRKFVWHEKWQDVDNFDPSENLEKLISSDEY